MGLLWSVIKRLCFLVFFICGGVLYYIPKWILVGTKASRDRQRIRKLLEAEARRREAGR